MAMAEEEFDREEFEEWVKQGLKISHGMNLDPLDDEDMPSLYPTAPVAFAFVTDVDAIDAGADPVTKAMVTGGGEISLPAMVPLPLIKFSVSGTYLGPPVNSLHVRLRASWTLRFLKPHYSSSHFALALPIQSDPPYSEGSLKGFDFKISNSSQPAAPPYSTKQPMFGNLHFIWLDSVNGGTQVSVDLSYLVRYSRLRSWTDASFSILTRLPFYANGFRGERNGDCDGTNRKLKMRLCLNVKEDYCIGDFALSFPYEVITREKSVLMLLHESQGPHVKWPDHHLCCTFAITPPETAKTNQTTQTLEPEAAKTKTLEREAAKTTQATQALEPEAAKTYHTAQTLEPQSKKICLTI